MKLLVDYYHGGKIRVAGRALGISSSTMSALVSGSITSPRANLVNTLVEYHRSYGVTADWLLSGAGPAPRRPEIPELFEAASQAAGGAMAWEEVVLGLNLPEPVQDALLALPDQMADARQRLGPTFEGLGVPAYRAVVHEYKAWLTWLTGWIATAGTAAVRRALTREAAALAVISQTLTQQNPTPNWRTRKETSR